jgi:hypothetical protein
MIVALIKALLHGLNVKVLVKSDGLFDKTVFPDLLVYAKYETLGTVVITSCQIRAQSLLDNFMQHSQNPSKPKPKAAELSGKKHK